MLRAGLDLAVVGEGEETLPLTGSPRAAERPGAIDFSTRELLARLEAQGSAHGQCRAQRARAAGA